ncbi:beta-ketoacyl synthase N-terminal-like domain-containing protein [Xenorhabdus sp. SF857]|uniref:beta-ketoacyl synthase N-terminal-like domain-containing protein n=1 Tax=Xenorhabdus bakwenae TaxID=3026967 RepID=UPI002557D895|nr:beta-ketoacyl synthase N-terminal-like domain-containing protein [Xenorhabdus sp. SF857]WFQ80638.1 beta-ketoacyl synthase N-terminal-like domain-containing protein [Xenorhabdus sp. SF857]
MNTVIREDLDIAVIGLSGRFPGAENYTAFWRNLLMGVDSISRFTEEELLQAGHDSRKIRNKDFVPVNGVLEGAGYFDAEFFEYSQAEAALLDPQTRLMMQCVWHALENAGVDPDKRGHNIGLFLGARSTVSWTMQAMLSEQTENVGGFLASQLANKDAMSTLISWKLGLQGPSFTLQTACSTSLVSVHQAVQSLLSGECDFAVAGGVSLLLPQQNGHIYQDGMLFSKDGKTRAFDADATGSVFGSGLGAVVLRRAGNAIADNDPIWAILKGSAINNDGIRKVGYTAPSVKGQTDVIRTAFQMAEMDAADLGFIECHGTATSLGDSIEFMALQEIFNENRSAAESASQSIPINQCALGSVKTNIGHLDSAAGIAGFIKTVMAVRYGVIPPTLYFHSPNPLLGLEQSPFYINTRAEPWLSEQGKPRTGGVSSFGIGGTNAHIVLQQYIPASAASAPDITQPCFFPFSAKNKAALVQQLESVSHWLVQLSDLDLAALSHTLSKRRSFPCRMMFVAESRFALMQQIKTYLAQEEHDELALIPQFLQQSTIPPDKHSEIVADISRWISRQVKEPAECFFPSSQGQPLTDVPGYAFIREEHGAGYITDKNWAQIASVITTTESNNLSKNMPGLLLPFWKAIRLPKEQEGTPYSRLLIDQHLALPANIPADNSQIEALHLNLACSREIRNVLAGLSDNLQINELPESTSLVLSLMFTADSFSFSVDSLQALSELGKTLAENDFSAFSSVHIYLIAPVGDRYSAESVLTESALKALALVLPQEIPGITCTFLSLQDLNVNRVSVTLSRLLQTTVYGPLKLNRDGLFVEDFRCPDPEENEVADNAHFIGKTYVITGASGRMARAMAMVIARRFQGKLALISRQSAETAAMQDLRNELSECGATAVEIFPYTLENEENALALFTSIRHRLGDIYAVIHAAGVTDGDSFSPLIQLNAEHYSAQLKPKAQVAAVLASVFTHIPVEYCFVTSSMSVFFGGIAHAPYATANLFLDGWAQKQNLFLQKTHSPNTHWVVINWETVHFEQPTDATKEDATKEVQGWGDNEVAFSGAEFPALFERSLREYDNADQKIFSAGQFMERLYSWGGRRTASSVDAPKPARIRLKPRPETLHAEYQPPTNKMQQEIADIWSQILGIDGIGIEDKFMALGGDSLKTIVMAEKVYKKTGKRIAIQDFFVQPTIIEIERQFLSEQQNPVPMLPSVDPDAPIVASSDQDLLYIHQITFADGSYNMPTAFRCPASISAAVIAEALEQLANRHPVLKCLFQRQGANLMMLPQRTSEVRLWVSEAGEKPEENAVRLEQFANQPFDLHTDLPVRAMMLTASVSYPYHQVLIVVHHIVCDAISLGILVDDFQRLLHGLPLPTPQYSFAAYRRYRQESANEDRTRKEKAYWLANLLPLPAPLSLPMKEGYSWHTDTEREQGLTLKQALTSQTSAEIRQLCDELGLSVSTFFLGIFGVLIAKIARADTFLLGVPVTGRMQPEELELVGYLVNMLALKVEPEADLPVADYLLQLNAQWTESVPYQTYPMSTLLDDLSTECQMPNRQGKHPLFDVVFNYLPLSLSSADIHDGSDFSRFELASEAAKFDLELEVSETKDAFHCLIQLRLQMFSEETARVIFGYFFELMNEVIANPEEEIQELLKNLTYGYTPESFAQVNDQDIDSEFNF